MPLNIEYLGCEYGFIEAKFMGENGEYLVDISAVYDPFDDWFFALENIDRLCPPHIVINPEGEELSINLRDELDDSRFSITIINGQSKGEKVFVCKTTPKEIIEQMYVKLMAFVHSDKYNLKDYEDKSSWGGFALSTYHNVILDEYARFGIKPFYERANCRFCGGKTHIYTIDDMLNKSHKIIDENKKVSALLSQIQESKYSIGIRQRISRLRDFEREHYSSKTPYRTIQATDSGIYLCFNENFEMLERIEVYSNVFNRSYLTNTKALRYNKLPKTSKMLPSGKPQDEITSYDEMVAFLSNIFGFFVDFDLKECIGTYDNNLLDENGNFYIKSIIANQKYHIPRFPITDDNSHCLKFLFESQNRKSNTIDCIALQFGWCEVDENMPLSSWCNQKILSMYPDYSGCYLWQNGTLINSDIEGYEFLENSKLDEELYAWGLEYEKHEQSGFDWVAYNKKGRELHKKLQDIIKKDYIILYEKSAEEFYAP